MACRPKSSPAPVCAIFGAIISVLISVVYGATAGYLGGRIDNVMMRTVDILLSVPFIFLVIIINVALGGTLEIRLSTAGGTVVEARLPVRGEVVAQ